jgi:hypothetical protein
MRKAILVIGAMLMMEASVEAGEPEEWGYDCPTLYHSWLPTHIGVRPAGWEWTPRPNDHPEAINKVEIFKEKAIVTWGGGRPNSTYIRQYKHSQTHYFFHGLSKDNSAIQIDIDNPFDYFWDDNKCRTKLYFISPGTWHTEYIILMKKID